LDSCINRFQKILEKVQGDNSFIVYNLGALNKEKGDSAQAVYFYTKLFSDEILGKQYFNLPSTTRKSLESDEVINSYENKVILLQSFTIDFPRKYFNLGIFNFDNENLDKALECFIKSYELDDSYIQPLDAIYSLSRMGHEGASEYLKIHGQES